MEIKYMAHRQYTTLFGVLVLFTLSAFSPLKAHAWEPNAKDVKAAIVGADFNAYSAQLTEWLNRKTPASPDQLTLSALDALLNDPVFEKALAQRQFIAKVGNPTLASAAKDPKNHAFLTWLMGNTEAMIHGLEGGTPVRVHHRRDDSWQISGSALTLWKRIFDAVPESKEGVALKLAIAVGMSPPGTGNRGAGQALEAADPLDRYNHFLSAYNKGELARGFEAQGVWEYRQVVSSNASDEDLAWARQMVNTWRPDLREKENVVSTTSEVWRRNSPISFDNTFKNVLAGGGKCGPRSSWAVFVNQAFGIPVVGVRQPGHAAAAYKSPDPDVAPQSGYAWKVVYGRGWGASNPGQDFFEGATVRSNLGQFMRVERMRWLASALTSEAARSAVTSLAHAITDKAVRTLTATPLMDATPFDAKPDASAMLTSFAGPSDDGDDYAARVRGFVYPPQTGEYTFRVASDDDSDLFVSTDASPDNKEPVAHVRGWTPPLNFKANGMQQSAPIHLEAGKRYYIEFLHRQFDGGDHMAVAWSGPGVSEGVIPGANLSPYPSGAKGSVARDVWRDVTTDAVQVNVASARKAVAEAPFEVGPGQVHIEAEDYALQSAVEVYDCVTGGKQLHFHKSRNNSWVEYNVDVPAAGVYELVLCTAAVNLHQYFMITAGDASNAPIRAEVPNSQGLWNIGSVAELTLAKGAQTLRVAAPVQRGVALRWLALKPKGI
jgi:hypothetical protein